MSPRRSILVVTVVHHPHDARIRHRQINALLDADWDVSYAAPFHGYGLTLPEPTSTGRGRLRCLDLPRAHGRRRVAAIRAARRLIRIGAPRHDLVLIHDADLLAAVAGLQASNIVWDVHEDTAAAVGDRPWIPSPLRGVLGWAMRQAERWAERRMPLLLAEYAYQDRFTRAHPVVPNTVRVPDDVRPPSQRRVVYLGTITMERGAREVVALAQRLAAAGEWEVEIMGEAHGEARDLLTAAHREQVVRWHGFVPSETALARLPGAMAGLSLLDDVPNYRHSMPTKVVEYMAHGVPVITTPLPLPATLVTDHGAGAVVPFGDVDAAAAAIERLAAHPDEAAAMGAAGHEVAREKYDWALAAHEFTAVMAQLASVPPRRP